MRNVLEEFLKPRRGQRRPTILGLREHIFTGRFEYSFGWKLQGAVHLLEYSYAYFSLGHSVSSLAWFMSNQETSFVTIGQRVLANPLRYMLRN